MNLSMIKTGGHQVGRFIYKNSPTILTWLGVSGFLGTIVVAVKATPEAMRLIETEKQFRKTQAIEEGHGMMPMPLTKLDIIKIAWKCYIPAIGIGTVSIACFVGANSINIRRNAAIASLYSLTRKAFDEYQEKVVEEIGKSKEEKIRENLAQDKLDKNPPSDSQVIMTGNGVLCYEEHTGRYFQSDPETIRKVVNELNWRLNRDGFVKLNQLYDEFGLEPTEAGKDVGWNKESGLIEVLFTTRLAKNNIPCLVVQYGRSGPRGLAYP